MALTLDESFERCCRLCAEEQEVAIMIFSAEAEAMLLQNKLNKYLLIEVEEDDKLPKNICLKCCTKLQTVCEFIDTAHRAQDKLLNRSLLVDQYQLEKSTALANEPCVNNVLEPIDDLGIQQHIKLENDIVPCSDEDCQVTEMEVSIDPMLILQNSEGSISPNGDNSQNNPENYSYGENVTIKLIKKADNSDLGSEDSVDKPFPCRKCNRSFNTELALKNHAWVHNQSKSTLYKCTTCEEGFDDKWDFIDHLKQHKTERSCQICKRVFRTEASLTVHMDIHKSQIKAYTCKVCFRSYNTMSNLKTHSITHSDERPYECHVCKKRFKRKQDLKFHINQHTGAKPYKCPFCDKSFASSGNCYSHRNRMHPGRQYESVKRRIVRQSKPNMTMTLSTKSPLVPVRGIYKYQCQMCDHSFMKRDNFLYHTYQHTGEKPFQCTFCPEKFVTRRGLILHHDKTHPTKTRPLAYISKNALLQ